MNANEPVAFIDCFSGKPKLIDGYVIQTEYDIPLYTHPVKKQGNPVAWRSQAPDGYWSVYQTPVEGAEPLYTGFKELTDEEIKELIPTTDCYDYDFSQQDLIDFARAILRKAQENG